MRIDWVARLAMATLMLGLATSTPARADEPSTPTRYQRLVAEALVEFEASRYEEALALFEHAYAEKPSARALRGIAKTLFELRAYARSLDAIDRALASPLDPLTGTLRDDVLALRERTLRFVGTTVVVLTPATARTSIDGVERTCSTEPGCVLDRGAHTLRASAAGHESVERTFEVHGVTPTRLTVRLIPLQRPVVEGPSRAVPIALGITATVVSAAGLVGSILWLRDRDAAVDRCSEATAIGARCDNGGGITTQRDAARWSVGLTSAAVAASATGLVLAFVWPRPKAAAVTSFACRTRGLGVGCEARW